MNGIVEFTAKHKVVVICRGLYNNELVKTIRALHGGGIRVVEITFDQANPDAVEKICGAIRTIKERFPQMKMGSDTVTCVEHMLATKKAGGGFCLSPDVNTGVIHATEEASLISIPEAITSAEILQAHNAGTDIVGVFPAGWLGLSCLKDIKGPINHVEFLAAASVNEEDFEEYLNAGYCVADINGRSIDRKVIAEGSFEKPTRRAGIFTDIANTC